jgi:hypothetical protein
MRLLLTMVFLVGAMAAFELARPGPVAACFCDISKPVVEVLRDIARAGDPDTVVLAGRIQGLHPTTTGGQSGTLVVTRVFKGVLPRLQLPIVGGGGGDCTVDLSNMIDVVMVAQLDRNAVVPGLCQPIEALGTAEGRALFDDAVAVFGTGPPSDDDLPTVPGAELMLLVSLGLAVTVAAGVFLLIARRRGTS